MAFGEQSSAPRYDRLVVLMLCASELIGLFAGCGSSGPGISQGGGGASGGGGLGGGGSGGGASTVDPCADLRSCCKQLPAALASACNSTADAGKTCASRLLGYESFGECQVGSGPASPSADGLWHPVEVISASDDDEVLGLGACGDGDAVVVWRRSSTATSRLYGSRYSATAGQWSVPELVADNAPASSGATDSVHTNISVAINANCDAMAVWVPLTPNADQTALWAASYRSGSAWVQWPSFATFPQNYVTVQVAIGDSADGFVGVMLGQAQIIHIDYSAATGFGTPVVAAVPSLLNMFTGMLPDGRGVQIYRTNSAVTSSLVRGLDGVWGDGLTLTTGYILFMKPAIDHFVLAAQPIATGYDELETLTPGDDVVALPPPTDLDIYNLGNGQGGRAAGNATALFFLTRETSAEVLRVARHDLASGWMPAETISAPGDVSDPPFDVAVDGQGRAIAYYTGASLTVNRFTPQGGWRGPAQMDHTLYTGRPFISMDVHGNAVIAWGGYGRADGSILGSILALRYVLKK